MEAILTDLLASRGGVLVLDGALGTELERRGVAAPAPLWSAAALLDAPGVVRQIHADYAAAGADILVANTFRANPRTLERAGLLDRGAGLCHAAVQFAREGAAAASSRRRPVVAASVGPVEDCYHPERVPDQEVLREEHRRFAEWLAAAEPDFLWIETINTVREAVAAAGAAREVGLDFAISFVTRADGCLLSGEPVDAALAAVTPLQPSAVGLNCIPPAGLARQLPELIRPVSGVAPVAAYGHIGNPAPLPGWSFAQQCTPKQYAAEAALWLAAGAQIIGGCCGTTPDHIAALRRMVDGGPASGRS